MDFIRLETQLKERLNFQYFWGRKQSNEWDAKTNFIYSTYTFEKLIEVTSHFTEDEKNYSFNRWYNFWSAMAVEKMFSLHKKVVPNLNKYDKLVDFSINKISFDHKTSVFPKGFNQTIDYAKQNPSELITWLYVNQSQDGRKHLENRLFIVLYDKNGDHWKLKSEIELIKNQVDNYVEHFDEKNLISITLENKKIISDIIWIERE
jgi:hypothetical protein